MDPRCDLRRQADVAHPAEPIEQFADVVRLRRNGHRLEPSEWCRVHRCVKHKQPVEFGNLLAGNRREQSVRSTPASASSTGYCRPFDDTAGRQNDRGCAERRDNRGCDGLSAISVPGCLSRSLNHHRQIGVRRRPKAQGHGEKPRVVPS
jgi:hypothetical protein